MGDPGILTKGQFYFSVSYPDSSFTKPIIASYEYVGEEMLENDDGKNEKHYLFQFYPVYKSENEDAIENGLIAYTKAQLKGLNSMEGLMDELESARSNQKNEKS